MGRSARRALLRVAALGAVAMLGACGTMAGQSGRAAGGAVPVRRAAVTVTSAAAPVGASARLRVKPPFTIVKRYALFIDHSRSVRVPGRGRQPRRLLTVIRYPIHATGPFPLVVFGHGFAVTPAIYHRLLRAWAQAGYVVAAPVFPLGSANAPGGPNESDIVNQPRDMSFVITRLLALSASHHGWLSGLIARHEIAVSGQSDGGETALAVAYDRYYIDHRVRAAVVLSGAELPGGGFDFPAAGPPLLAAQGTADTINQPRYTYAFFNAARRPKFLLKLIGAPHLPPYTSEEPQLSIVERVTIAFLDHYLKGTRGQLAKMVSAGDVPGQAVLIARR